MFIELPGGHIVNDSHIVRLKDITGTGHYRIFMRDGFSLDAAPEEARRVKVQLGFAVEETEASEVKEVPKKHGPGRPPKTSKGKDQK